MQRAMPILLILFTAASSLAEEAVDYATQIKPIFAEHCGKCHGERAAQGELRLHTVAAIEEFGADYLLSPEAPEDGAILARLTLPADDEMMMPKGGKPLPEETIDLVRRWISQGAKMDASADPPSESPEDKLPDVPPAEPEAIRKLESAGAQVMPLFQGSPLLRVTFAYADEKAGDEDVALLTDVAPQVVALDLARSEVSDEGLAPLAQLVNLSQLHLEQTTVGDDALAHLTGLTSLEYLNLYATKVTDAGIKQLEGLPKLQKLYLWQTPVSYDAAMALASAREGLEVNLGWDHPEVARRRLTEELARVQTNKEDASQRLEQAKREQEAAAAREEQIQKELAALDGEPKERTTEEPEAKAETPAVEKTDEQAKE